MENGVNNINNYSIQELIQILQIDEPDKEKILTKTNFYIEKYAETNEELATFFRKAQQKLLGFFDNYDKDNLQGDLWRENQYLPNNDKEQNIKITDRPQKTEIFNDSNQIFIKRKQLGISETYEIPVISGKLNPNLKNTFTRIINIDSQYRQNSVPSLKNVNYKSIAKPVSLSTWSSTNFSLDLSDPLTNVLSLKLYSLQIPFTWYNISDGLNCFKLKCGENEYLIKIEPGNYTSNDIREAINESIINIEKSQIDNDNDKCHNWRLELNKKTGKFNFIFKDDIETNTDIPTTFTFWEGINNSLCENDCENISKINNNLGWILGFRNTSYTVKTNELKAEAFYNLEGPKYIILVLEDFNTNRINKGLVTIQDIDSKLSLPKYYQPGDINELQIDNLECISPNPQDTNVVESTFVKVPTYTQGLPRVITQKQQYSLNEIIKNRKISTNQKITPPSTTNVFAIVPLRSAGKPFGELITEFSGPLPLNIRNYFGPVDIERMKVTLYDDKGNILNLNGAEWSFTMISEHLYQY